MNKLIKYIVLATAFLVSINCAAQPGEELIVRFIIKLPDGFKYEAGSTIRIVNGRKYINLKHISDFYSVTSTDFKTYGNNISFAEDSSYIWISIGNGIGRHDTFLYEKIIVKITLNNNPYCFVIHNMHRENFYDENTCYLGEIILGINRYEYFVQNEKMSLENLKNINSNIKMKRMDSSPYNVYNLSKYLKKQNNEKQISSLPCPCNDIQFQLILPNVKLKKDSANYAIKMIGDYFNRANVGGRWRNFEKAEIKKNVLRFALDTKSGVDTLKFVIRNDRTNAEMIITVTNIIFDTAYFIDLTKFSPGHYFIDWQKIDTCQRENPCTELIDCDGMKFYQVQEEEASFFCNKIKLYDLEGFRK